MIVTHLNDKPWLEWCLKSIRKFVTGYNEVVVLVPSAEAKQFQNVPAQLKSFNQAPPPKGHIHHCIQKCRADCWCKADAILFLDADCIFREPVSVSSDYFVGGKPVLLMESYESMKKNGCPALCWRAGTEDVMGFRPVFEFMRRHPAVHWRDLFQPFRDYITGIHHQDFETYALSRQHGNPVGFNDFNNLGAYAARFMADRYHFIDLTNWPERRPRDHIIQYWSHGGLNRPQDRWLDGKLERVIPLQEIKHLIA